jgi:tRNA modification GTPase
MNALAGFQRAIVCDLPGTTRDVVTTSTAIDGWPVLLADTAGLRATRDELESAGVARATAAVADADLVVLVSDVTADAAEALPPAARVLRVLNKIDLPTLPSRQSMDVKWDVMTSAVTGEGIAPLVNAIGRALVPSPPAAGAAVPFTADQVQRLEDARAAIARHDAAAADRCLRALLA